MGGVLTFMVNPEAKSGVVELLVNFCWDLCILYIFSGVGG